MRILYELPRQSLVCISHSIGSILVVGIQCLLPGNRIIRKGIVMTTKVPLKTLVDACNYVMISGYEGSVHLCEVPDNDRIEGYTGNTVYEFADGNEYYLADPGQSVKLDGTRAIVPCFTWAGTKDTKMLNIVFYVSKPIDLKYLSKKLVGAE